MEFLRCYGCMEELGSPGAVCPHCGYDNTNEPRRQPNDALPCRTILAGRYVTGKVLGRSGLGVTYLGYDLKLTAKVSIMEFFPSSTTRAAGAGCKVDWGTGEQAQLFRQQRGAFIKEATAAVRLRSQASVVKVWDVFTENNTGYAVMDYVSGETLKLYLQHEGPMDEASCIRLFSPLMRDLEELHAQGIVHRDITPDTILRRPNGELILLGFGTDAGQTGSGAMNTFRAVSPGFSPIEQYSRQGVLNTATDVYELCAVIAWCCTGSALPAPTERMNGAAPDLSRFSPEVKAVLEKGLEVQPVYRLQSMEELRTGLEKALPETGLAATPTSLTPIKCPSCGKDNHGNARFCRHCGKPIRSDGGVVPIESALQPPLPQQLGLGWHKFMINFALFASAVLNLWTGIRMITGLQYGNNAQAVYRMYGGMKAADIIFGLLTLGLAGFGVFTRFRLAGFKRGAPILLLILYIAGLVVSFSYLGAATAITRLELMDESTWGSLIGSVTMAIVNYIYYKKRKDLFVN